MSEIKAALTPEEWATEIRCAAAPDFGEWEVGIANVAAYETQRPLHAIAAACLHNQPFGFTREDVRWLRGILKATGDTEGRGWYMADSIADRIEALLPPVAT